jgi:small-conductance mechanosensitive channel
LVLPELTSQVGIEGIPDARFCGDDWIPLLHTMNMAIDREFREAGITIAFPQRDVHLDATGPLEVRVVSEDSKA